MIKLPYRVGDEVWILVESRDVAGRFPAKLEIKGVNVVINLGMFQCPEPAEIRYRFDGSGDNYVWRTPDAIYESYEAAID